MKQVDLEPKDYKRKACLSVCLVAAFISPSVANAQFFTGNSLHAACKSSPDFVMGWASGFVDGQFMVSTTVDENQESYGYPKLCIPKGVNAEQVRDVICKSLDNNPADRNWQSGFLAFNAIIEAWPCS